MITSNAKDRGEWLQLLSTLWKYFTNSANSKPLALANITTPSNSAALNDPAVQAINQLLGLVYAMKNGVPMSSSPYSVLSNGVPVAECGNSDCGKVFKHQLRLECSTEAHRKLHFSYATPHIFAWCNKVKFFGGDSFNVLYLIFFPPKTYSLFFWKVFT